MVFILLICFFKQAEPDGFFYWCDGYVALAENENIELSFTYFYEKRHINFEDIIDVDFLAASMVTVDSYDIFEREEGVEFKSYGITLDLSMKGRGKEVLEYLQIEHNDGTKDIFPLGTWVFVSGPEDCDLLDTWESPVVSSDSQKFVFVYNKKYEDIAVKYIQCAEVQNNCEMEVAGDLVSGVIELSSNAPMSFIKSMITMEVNNQTKIAYGKGCYCGAMDVTKESIIKSKKFSKEKQKAY